MEFVKLLMSDDAERAHFALDPDDSLSEHGLADLSPADVHDAVVLVQDTLTVDWAQAYGAGAGAAPTPGLDPALAPSPVWTAEEPDPVIEHDDPAPSPATPVADDVLWDVPDLHFGH